ASTNGIASRAASRRPIDDLPEPIMPTSTTERGPSAAISVASSGVATASSVRAISGMSRPGLRRGVPQTHRGHNRPCTRIPRRFFTKLHLAENRPQPMPPRFQSWRPATQGTEIPLTDQPNPQPPARRRGRAAAVILGVALAGGLVGAFATSSFSQGFGPPWHMTVRGPMGFGGPLTTDQIVDRADRMVRHVAIELDATPDQQQKLEAIVKSAVTDL